MSNARKNPCNGKTKAGKDCGGGAQANGYCGVHQDQAVCPSCGTSDFLVAGVCQPCDNNAQKGAIVNEKDAAYIEAATESGESARRFAIWQLNNEKDSCIYCGGPATCRDPYCPGDMTEVLQDNDNYEKEGAVKKFKCATCKQWQTIEEIKVCGSKAARPQKAEVTTNRNVGMSRCGVCKTTHPTVEVRACYTNRNKEVK